MAKAPQPAIFTAVKDSAEQVILDMLGDDLATAVVAARTRLQDASVMCRIGAHPSGEPDDAMPGLVSVERDGASTVYGLSHEDAIAALEALV